MLRSFRAGNHRSIRGEQELLLMPAYASDRPVVPVAAIFGANAAGKSNLVDALAFMQDAVRNSHGSWGPNSGVPRQPFRQDPSAQVEDSVFVVDLLLDGTRYVYGFTVDDRRVLEEWLYSYPHGRRRILFDRNEETVTFGRTTSAAARGKFELLKELTRPNALLLTVAANSRHQDAQPVYRWFDEMLEITGPELLDRDGTALAEAVAARSDDPRLPLLLRAADLGVTDVRVTDPGDRGMFLAIRDGQPAVLAARANLEKTQAESADDVEAVAVAQASVAEAQSQAATISSRLMQTPALVFFHGPERIPLEFRDQSHGTRVWLRQILRAVAALDTGGMLVIDEIDCGLHSRLVAQLIRLFSDHEANPSGAQLVFTTHDATLLGTDSGEEILRRDEIWFVEKDASGSTGLFSLAEFHPRKGENRERRYLSGSYGAVPVLSEYEFSNAVRPA